MPRGCFLLVAGVLVATTSAQFRWMAGGNPIVVRAFDLSSCPGMPVWSDPHAPPTIRPPTLQMEMTGDGAGGAIITWQDCSGEQADIRAQRVGADGHPLWGSEGIGLCRAPYSQFTPVLTTDGRGGAFIAWSDARSGDVLGADVYLHHVFATGEMDPRWPKNGHPVCTAIGGQFRPKVVSDAAGGALIVWEDRRHGNTAIFAQRLGPSGSRQWPPDGICICDSPGGKNFDATTDGAHGLVIVWDDERGGGLTKDIYAQRVSAGGRLLWKPDGERVCDAREEQFLPSITTDGRGGVYLAWLDYRAWIRNARGSTRSQIFLQALDADGRERWAHNGTPVAPPSAVWVASRPKVLEDSHGGAIVVWECQEILTQASRFFRKPERGWSMRHVDASGRLQWQPGPTISRFGRRGLAFPAPSADSLGITVVWTEEQDSTSSIRTQRFALDGTKRWASSAVTGKDVGRSPFPRICAASGGDVVVAWQDSRIPGWLSIYAQRVGGAAGPFH